MKLERLVAKAALVALVGTFAAAPAWAQSGAQTAVDAAKKYSGTEIKIEGDEHVILREDEVLGVLI